MRLRWRSSFREELNSLPLIRLHERQFDHSLALSRIANVKRLPSKMLREELVANQARVYISNGGDANNSPKNYVTLIDGILEKPL